MARRSILNARGPLNFRGAGEGRFVAGLNLRLIFY